MKNLQFNILENQSLADHNSWRVGGKARAVFFPENIEHLALFLKNHFSYAVAEKIFWMGLGSNLLVSDTGFDGTVIITRGLKEISLKKNNPQNNTVRIEAGVPCGTAARFCARLGLTGLEFLAGVPGTIGGALAMNAGAHGSETWEFVTHCEMIDRQGRIILRPASDYKVSYRQVISPENEWFAAAHLALIPGSKTQSLLEIKNFLAHRARTQPINLPNCGSVFKNPPNHYAAQLIESAGLKNYRIGGAVVSEKHANFIVNTGAATALDIQNLIQHIQSEIKHYYHIDLQCEVQKLNLNGK